MNDPWGNAGQADQMRQDGAVHNGVNATKVSAIRNLPSLDKKGKELCVYLPPKAQLEALVTLVRALIAVDVLQLQIEHTWLNLVNVNPRRVASEKLDDMHAYWILNNAGSQLDDARLSGINGNVSGSGWSRSSPGLYTHLLLGGHTDGLVEGLYTWMRIDQNMSADIALATLTNALSDGPRRVDGGGGLALMDITDIVYQEV